MIGQQPGLDSRAIGVPSSEGPQRPRRSRRWSRQLKSWQRRHSNDVLALLLLAIALGAILIYAAAQPPTAWDGPVDQLPQALALRGFYDLERDDNGPFLWSV